MLWNLIRDFFVEHVFGGTNSLSTSFNGVIGYLMEARGGVYDDENLATTATQWLLKIGGNTDTEYYITLGDWLSTTATIISISIIVVLCCLFVYKIIKLIGGLVR